LGGWHQDSILRSQELADPNTGLSTYVASKALYHCPAANYIDTFAGDSVHVRSYSMNSTVGTIYSSANPKPPSYVSGGPPIGTAVNGGFLDEAYQNKQTTYRLM
jgi:hypothetical protein